MDKTEQVTLGMKQSLYFHILSFFKKWIINNIFGLFNLSGQIAVAPSSSNMWTDPLSSLLVIAWNMNIRMYAYLVSTVERRQYTIFKVQVHQS